tara:strand:- start:59 stop:562 length:504 start_codon:yes stop_codon:yes gene_type:complete
MKHIKNFLDKNTADKIEKLLSSVDFPWFYKTPVVENRDNNENVDHDYFFSHIFCHNNNFTSLWYDEVILPIIKKLDFKINNIYRARANLTNKTTKHIRYGFHNDHDFNHKVLLYYVNSNNGYVNIEDKNLKIKPIKNSLLLVDGKTRHEVVSQTDTNIRLVVNITYD